jgi:pimeloyl-ACP methyl ester carboxylesterase
VTAADTTGSRARSSARPTKPVPDRISAPRPAEPIPHTSTLGRGWPTVVCEPGLGASSAGWSHVRDGIAALTRVATYDRRGLGGSPANADRRDLTALAADLADVITHGCADGPVVLVGHSLGATLARYLAATRPDLVAGLVLIDPIPDRWVLRHARWAAPFGQAAFLAMTGLARLGLIDVAMALPVLSGVTRSSTSPLAVLSEEDRDVLAEEMRRPLSHTTSRREFTGLLRSQAELRHLDANPAAPVPLTMISGGQTHRLAARLRRDATEWHAGLVRASPDARHIVVGDGCHSIPRYRPDLVADAVAELLGRIRSDRAQRTAR